MPGGAVITANCQHCGIELVIVVNLPGLTAELADIRRVLHLILTKEDTIMTAQEDIDAAVAAISAAVADLTTQAAAIVAAQANVDTEIQALQAEIAAGNTAPDTTALVAAGAALADATAGLDSTVSALAADPNVPAAP
jgi:hypothetical protein